MSDPLGNIPKEVTQAAQTITFWARRNNLDSVQIGEVSYQDPTAPPSELVKAAGDAILILRCLSIDESLTESWRDKADRAANGLSAAFDK